MKITNCFLLLTIILSIVLTSCVNGKKDDTVILKSMENSVFELTADKDFHISTEEYEIYGNYTDFDKALADSVIESGKVLVCYDIDTEDNVRSDHEILVSNAYISYLWAGASYVYTLSSNTEDILTLAEQINDFLDGNLSRLKSINRTVTAKGNVEIVSGGSFIHYNDPYGYVNFNYTVYKTGKELDYDVFKLQGRFELVPGVVGMRLGDQNYDEWYNSRGCFKVGAVSTEKDEPYDYWDKNIEVAFDDASPKGNGLGDEAVKINNSRDSTDSYIWSYEYNEPAVQTMSIDINYCFKSRYGNADRNDFNLIFQYQMTVNNDEWSFFNEDVYVSGVNYHTNK